MSVWPFKHNWDESYIVTYSFKTEILTSRSGREQRRAIRFDPRQTVQTSVLEDSDTARAFDDWTWSTGAEVFTFADPVSGGNMLVRLPSEVALEHPCEGVVSATVILSVETGIQVLATEDGQVLLTEDGQSILV